MSNTIVDDVYPARKLYHRVYGSSDGTVGIWENWEYWVVCASHPKRDGVPVMLGKGDLVSVDEAESRGLKRCGRCI